MLFATDDSGAHVLATPGASATCPFCGMSMIARCGAINIWHWAHKASADCDPWCEGETAWHLAWKQRFPGEWIERTVTAGATRHIADIQSPTELVIDLQHSYLAPGEIRERETFYGQIIWVFDITDCVGDIHSSPRFVIRFRQTHWTFRWYHAKKHIAATTKPAYLDLGGGWLFDLQKMHLGPPCGGWGYLVKQDDLLAHVTKMA